MVKISEVLNHHGFGSGSGMNVIHLPTEPDGEISEGTVWHNTVTGESKMFLNDSFRSIGSSGTYFSKFTKRIRTTATSKRIQIPVEEYKPGIDIMTVTIDGQTILENFDYAIDRDLKEIVSLGADWVANTSVDFDVAVITTIPDEDSRMFLQYEDDVIANEGENTIVFNIPNFVPEYDILRVHQRNLEIFEGEDFTLDPGAASISLHYVLEEDDRFHFTVIKQVRRGDSGVDGGSGGGDTELEQAKLALSGATYRNIKERLDVEWQESYKEKDFVETIREMNGIGKMKLQVKASDAIDLYVPTINGKHVQYQINKNNTDDFSRLRQGSIGTLVSGSQAIETHTRDYQFESGAFVKASAPDYYTTNIGAKIYGEFYGTGLDVQHFTDTRGGVYGFSIDGGPEILISTHIDAVASQNLVTSDFAKQPVVRNLTEGTHEVIATFKGNDPDHPPSSAPSRGWIRYSSGSPDKTRKSFVVYGFPVIFGQEFEILNDSSYKEMSFRLAPSGSSMTPQWIPEVNNVATLFEDSKAIYFDGKLQSALMPQGILEDVNEVKVVQKMFAKHPDDAQPILKWIFIHTFTSKGLHTKASVEFLKECFVTEGYGLAVPYSTSFGNAIKTGFDKVYASVKTDNSVTAFTENDKAANYVIYHNGEDDDRQHFAIGLKVHNLRQAMRYGADGVSNPPVYIQHRNAVLQELKLQPYKSVVVSVGHKYEMEYSLAIGAVPFAKDVL